MEATEKRGRPRVERDPNERVPMSLRLRGALFNRLSEMARANNRPLGLECEYRLERSFDASVDPRAMTRDLIYENEGIAGLIAYLINVEGNPDENERAIRAAAARNATLLPRSEWLPPDKPRFTVECDAEGRPVAYVELDTEGRPVSIVRRDADGNLVVVEPPR
jgi:hypothetical protein